MAKGSIRSVKTKSGETHYRLIVEGEPDPITGKRNRHYATCTGTKKEADSALRKFIDEVERGKAVKQAPITLLDWINEWVEMYIKPYSEVTTLVGYRSKIHCYIEPGIGKMKLKDIRPDHVQRMVNSMLDEKLSPKSIRDTYNIINASLKKAVVQRKIPYNPCEGIELPRLKKRHTKVFDEDDIQDALNHAKGTDMYLPFLLLITTGMRRGELLALRWENVDLKKQIISVKENLVRGEHGYIVKAPKTDSGIRDIYIGDELLVELKKARKQYADDMMNYGAGFNPAGYVIHLPNGDPLRPDSLTQKWERFLERYDLPKIRLHDIRHSNATALLKSGVNIKVVSHRLGHSDVSTTLNIYAHVLPGMDAEAAEKLDDIILKKA